MSFQPIKQEVVVTDVHMQFTSMVVFMLKWAIAAIPAMIVLAVMATLFWGVLVALVMAPSALIRSRAAAAETSATPTAEEAQGYQDSVVISNVKVAPDQLGEVALFGEITNRSLKTLSKVTLTIYCYNAEGKVIFDKKLPVIAMTTFRPDEPLKAGYIRKFAVKMDDVPSGWNKKVEVKVTDAAFVDSKEGEPTAVPAAP